MQDFKPFVSLLMVILTLFAVVFIKMEVRTTGYAFLKDLRVYLGLQAKHRDYSLAYAKATNPKKLQKWAEKRLNLTEAKQGQVILMEGDGWALAQ